MVEGRAALRGARAGQQQRAATGASPRARARWRSAAARNRRQRVLRSFNLQKVWPGWVVGYCRAPVWCDFEVLSCAFGDRCPSAHHLWNTLSSSEKAVRS